LCGEDSDTFLLSGHDTLVGDLIDGADLLQELRTLNNVQKVSAKEAYSKHSDDQLFPNFTTRQLSWHPTSRDDAIFSGERHFWRESLFRGLKSPWALFLTKRVPEVSKSVRLIGQKNIYSARTFMLAIAL